MNKQRRQRRRTAIKSETQEVIYCKERRYRVQAERESENEYRKQREKHRETQKEQRLKRDEKDRQDSVNSERSSQGIEQADQCHSSSAT